METTESPAIRRVSTLLAETSSAHRQFEIEALQGARDEHWPAWYAGYLLGHGLPELIGQQLGESELADLLRACDDAYRRAQPQESWPDFYARRLVAGH